MEGWKVEEWKGGRMEGWKDGRMSNARRAAEKALIG